MNYALHQPCSNCPFRKEGGIRLRAGRVQELIASEGEFACHKTTREDEDGERVAGAKSQHCAGALIFAEKRGGSTQMMRIAARLGLYDPRQLKGHDEIFDTPREMLATAIDYAPVSASHGSCSVVLDASCEAQPELELPAAFECWGCGLDVCGACSTVKIHIRLGEQARVCQNCLDERGDEFAELPVAATKKATAPQPKKKPATVTQPKKKPATRPKKKPATQPKKKKQP